MTGFSGPPHFGSNATCHGPASLGNGTALGKILLSSQTCRSGKFLAKDDEAALCGVKPQGDYRPPVLHFELGQIADRGCDRVPEFGLFAGDGE